MEDIQIYVMLAGYALGVFTAAMATEACKAVIWAGVFYAFFRPRRKK